MNDANGRNWSEQQVAIFEWVKSGVGHLVVRARAGTGKTTTIIQALVYAAVKLGLLVAFNKRIATELSQKLKNPSFEAKTLHAIGYKFVMRNWAGIKLDEDRGWTLAKKAEPQAPDSISALVKKLASFAKGSCPFPTVQNLVDLAIERDLTPDEDNEEDGWTVERIATIAKKAMDLACEKDGTLDFDDMCFVPVRNGWLRPYYDLVIVDEAQDMNATQLIIAQKSCKKTGRIVVVGDDRQAIYGFRGADSNSIDRLKSELNATELPLTITYRCPKAVVALAQQLVPDYVAADTAPEGVVRDIAYEQLFEQAQVNDFILSRKNAPLAKACMKFLRAGKRAKIEGKDIGAGLIAMMKKVKGRSMPDFMARLAKFEEKQVARIRASAKDADKANALVEAFQDKTETLRVLAQDLASIKELETRINGLFDQAAEAGGFIVLSSVHKAKGLETDRCFLLTETFRTFPVEEQNIKYVAITRAKRELVWVTGVEKAKEA